MNLFEVALRPQDRVRAGTAHAALVFDGDDCVGWCQFGPPAEVSRITNRKEYEKQLDELPDRRIACCYVGKGHRRRGVSTFECAGFRPDREIGKHRWVVTTQVAPA